MLTRTVRRGLPVVALAAAGLALTACGPDSASSAPSGSSPSAPAASSATSPGSSTDGANADGSTSAGGSTGTAAAQTAGSSSAGGTAGGNTGSGTTVPACTTSRLKTTAANFDAGAGTAGFQIVFANAGSAPCTLRGYPGVSFVAAHNTQLGKAGSRTAGDLKTVTLLPNGHAYADVLSVNGQAGYSAAQCHLTTVPTLRVYPPNQKESTNIPWNRPECVGSTVQNLRIGPVHGNR
ncbi:DUF4232 domain-containing protein [Actinacidiphila rubida]|uniref:DUF4232 domain-containing protein n=1 Tax=Actinacidiphila rubida TaxID=310780 RepID=A0A1H8KYB8_9ACTN|nr:DUF4232 domain-containing protein [Actinacidiphila rubida]SEN97892.1 Protein of unknown function [Actinacidiphila rubida]